MRATRRILRLAILIGILTLIFVWSESLDQRRQPLPDFRAPVANPPVEPDRPDLLEEPKPGEQPLN